MPRRCNTEVSSEGLVIEQEVAGTEGARAQSTIVRKSWDPLPRVLPLAT